MASVFSFRALHFVRTDPRLLAYGLLLTFSSSFGQTYFISLLSGEIRGTFAISNGEFGAIYARRSDLSVDRRDNRRRDRMAGKLGRFRRGPRLPPVADMPLALTRS